MTVRHRDQTGAVAEVLAVAAVYILLSTGAVAAFDASAIFPPAWTETQRSTGSGFLIGAIAQIALVLIGAYLVRLRDLRRAIGAVTVPATREAWIVAGIATAIHIGTAIMLFLPQPERVLEPSALNLTLSAISAADGWSQEVLFRGYVLFRLARAGLPAMVQIATSGALFAAIHFGYTGESAFEYLAPLIGTFMLGCFYAWSVRAGGGSLKPVVVCHMLIIAALQPWLALAR